MKNLSGGELQRVAITLALGTAADIYLIDEPSAYLDSEQRIVAAKVPPFNCPSGPSRDRGSCRAALFLLFLLDQCFLWLRISTAVFIYFTVCVF